MFAIFFFYIILCFCILIIYYKANKTKTANPSMSYTQVGCRLIYYFLCLLRLLITSCHPFLVRHPLA